MILKVFESVILFYKKKKKTIENGKSSKFDSLISLIRFGLIPIRPLIT